MPSSFDTTGLESRPESDKALLRFADPGPKDVPKLSYSLPLPNSYEGQFFLEVDVGAIPFKKVADDGERRIPPPPQTGGVPSIRDLIVRNPDIIPSLVKKPTVVDPPPIRTRGIALPIALAADLTADRPQPLGANIAVHTTPRLLGEEQLEFNGDLVPLTEVETQARQNRTLVFYQGFSGLTRHGFVPDAPAGQSANPRFVIIERYRLTSLFGNYGAGRTVATFSLWPGEETSLYVRSWRRTEQRAKEASTIFDSYTTEAASDFETSLDRESANRSAREETSEWQAEGGFGINLGIFKIGGGGGGGGSSKAARESMAKTVSRVSSHHASKASAKRETSVSTELEVSEAAEFESITERRVENVNLSRVLNIVCRELNQEFQTYLSLIDVTVAFANDLHVFDEVALHELDALVAKYVEPTWPGSGPSGADSTLVNMS